MVDEARSVPGRHDVMQERFVGVVAALTEAARCDGDVADFLAHAVAAAAANLGGVEQLLAGRPGSWEADLVRQLVSGTVGWDGEYLYEHRTDPIVVRVNVEDILADLGVAALYERAYAELDRRDDAVWTRLAVTTDPGADADAEFDAIDRVRGRLNVLLDADWVAYGQAFAEQVRQAAAELFPTLSVPVEVLVATYRLPDEDTGDVAIDGPEWRLWEAARDRTPLPGSGVPLADYPPGTDIAEAIRAAGRAPLARLTTSDASTDSRQEGS